MATDTPTARDLVAMLLRHYQPEGRPPAGVFASEIGSPDGSRRADLIWLPTTVAGGKNKLHGHEVKVSRSDVLAELVDPTKADPWAKYCHRWWLVVAHPRLVDGLDVPEAWGVMAPPSGRRTRSMTVVKPAPSLRPQEPGPGIAKVAAWQLYGHYDTVNQLKRSQRELEREVRTLRMRVVELQAAGASSSPAGQKVARIVHAAETRLHDKSIWFAHLDADRVVEALVDQVATVQAAQSLRRDLRNLIDQVRQVLDPFRYSLSDLEKAQKLADEAAGVAGGRQQ